MSALDEIKDNAHLLAIQRRQLRTLVEELNAALQALQDDRMDDIRACITAAEQAWKALEASIQAHPEQFVKPRKVQAHGIVFGIEQTKPKLDIADEDKTVALIRKLMPEQAEVLITTVEKPVKAALMTLPAAELKRLGVSLIAAKDQVVIRPADGEVDKLVKALITAAIEEQQE